MLYRYRKQSVLQIQIRLELMPKEIRKMWREAPLTRRMMHSMRQLTDIREVSAPVIQPVKT